MTIVDPSETDEKAEFERQRSEAVPPIVDALEGVAIDVAASALAVVLLRLICVSYETEAEALTVVEDLQEDLLGGIALHFAPKGLRQ